MANLNGFNANQVEPSQDFEPIPAGKYLATITESELRPTKSGQGQYLQLSFQILEGPYKGRFLWSRLNLHNANATATQIARQELSAICRAVNVMQPADSAELHNLPLLVHVKLKRRADTGDTVNEIRGFSRRETAPASSPAAQGTPSTPPWRR